MKTIKVYEPGDKVFWLNGLGFQEGKVVSVSYNAYDASYSGNGAKYEAKLITRCKTDRDLPQYQGDAPEHVFDSWEEMIEFYKSKKP